MKHDPIERPARMAQKHVRWVLLAVERRSAKTKEAAAMPGGLGRTSYPTKSECLTAPRDIASAAEARFGAWERGEAASGERMARGVPPVMALMRSGSEGTP